MSTQPTPQPQQNPLAEFGGIPLNQTSQSSGPSSGPSSVTSSAPTSSAPTSSAPTSVSNPLAEFGGIPVAQPLTQQGTSDATARSEAYKQKAWSGVVNGVHAGDLKAAAHSFLSLFQNPDESVNPVENAIGIAKSAGQTINTVSELVSKILPSVVRPQDVQALKVAETPTTPSEQFGGHLETLAEFMMGEEGLQALEGLSYTQRLAKLVPYMKQLEESPRLLKTIRAAYNVAKMSGLTAGVSAAHPGEGETRGQAALKGAEAGAVFGTAGEAVGAIGEAMPAIKNVIRGGQPKLQTAIRQAGETAAAKAEALGSHPDILDKQVEVPADDAHPVKLVYDEDGNVTDLDGRHRVIQAIDDGKETIPVQVTLRDGTTSMVQQDPKVVAAKFGVTKESLAATDETQPYRAGNLQPREPVTKPAAKSATAATPAEATEIPATPKTTGGVRTAVEEVSNEVKAKSQKLYQQLDRESGGRWQRYEDQIKNLNDKMDEVNGIDDEAYDRLETKRNDIETSQAQMLDDLKEKGIDRKVADDAVAHYKQAMALRDLDKAVKGSTAGDTRVGLKETVDPKKFVTRVQKLYDSGRLEQALGKEGADALVKEAYTAKSAKSLQTVAKWSAGILAARYAGGSALHHILTAASMTP